MPGEARDLVRAYVRSEPLIPVARLATERSAVDVHDPRRCETVEIVDDLVTAYDGHRQVKEFREVEVELKAGNRAAKAWRVLSLPGWGPPVAGPSHQFRS